MLAVREDVGLSIVLVVAIPVAVIVLGLVIARMVPAFQLMQTRIDRINTVLREQITGIRVVRAFVREPQESDRFAAANADVTEVALRAGRLMSLMFPTVGLILNVSSIAVLWVGADRGRQRRARDRLARRLPVVPRADPDVGRDGDVHDVDDPAGGGGRRAGRRGARHRVVRAPARVDRSPR